MTKIFIEVVSGFVKSAIPTTLRSAQKVKKKNQGKKPHFGPLLVEWKKTFGEM